MKIENLDAIEALEGFLQGNQAVAFSVLGNKPERYQFIRKTLVKFDYMTLSKKDKGELRWNYGDSLLNYGDSLLNAFNYRP